MKLLIALLCCHVRTDWSNAQRQTWVQDIRNADYKVFYGHGYHELLPDEIQLDVPDDYNSLAVKTHGILQWAMARDYEYVFKCSDDAYVFPDRLNQLEDSDYVGGKSVGIDGDTLFEYQGLKWGCGDAYWLSKKAIQILASHPIPYGQADEPWVADTLRNQNIFVTIDNRIGCYGNIIEKSEYNFHNVSLPNETAIIASYEYNPVQMREVHKMGLRLPTHRPRPEQLNMTIGTMHIKNPA